MGMNSEGTPACCRASWKTADCSKGTTSSASPWISRKGGVAGGRLGLGSFFKGLGRHARAARVEHAEVVGDHWLDAVAGASSHVEDGGAGADALPPDRK